MSISNRLTKNAGLVMTAGIATRLFSFVFIAYAARKLGPHDFGIYILIGTIAFLFHFFGNLGIGPMAIREMARDTSKIEEMFNHIISMRLVLVLVFYPVLVGAIHLVGYSREIEVLIYISGLSAIASTLSHSFSIIYTAREQFKFPSLVAVLVSFLDSSANIFILYLGYGLRELVIVSLIGSVLATVISGLWIRKRVTKFKFVFEAAVWKDLVAQSMPFAILAFLRQASSRMNTLLLSKLPGAGPAAIGFYNPAIALCRQVMILPNSFRQAALPTVSSNAGDIKIIKGIIDKSTRILVVLVAFPLIIATSFFPGEIITLAFGAQYLPSVPALRLFGWAFALHIYNTPVSVTLTVSRDINKFIPWALLFFCIDIILAVPLIIYYSFIGAALAFLISKMVETCLRHHLLKVIWGFQVDTVESLFKLIAPMALIFLALLFVCFFSIGTLTFILLTAVLYCGALYYYNILGRLMGHIPMFRGRFRRD